VIRLPSVPGKTDSRYGTNVEKRSRTETEKS
jgi:hypothetical protein